VRITPANTSQVDLLQKRFRIFTTVIPNFDFGQIKEIRSSREEAGVRSQSENHIGLSAAA
jgi:hypothetical protein